MPWTSPQLHFFLSPAGVFQAKRTAAKSRARIPSSTCSWQRPTGWAFVGRRPDQQFVWPDGQLVNDEKKWFIMNFAKWWLKQKKVSFKIWTSSQHGPAAFSAQANLRLPKRSMKIIQWTGWTSPFISVCGVTRYGSLSQWVKEQSTKTIGRWKTRVQRWPWVTHLGEVGSIS